MKKRSLSIILCLCIILSVFSFYSCSDKKSDTIIILYENDVHCEVDGYSKLAAMKKELAKTVSHVGVVSSGDFIQGGTLGASSKGEYIINLMNLVGYDAIALGNHEFDYKIERLNELNAMSDTKLLSCNFTKVGEEKSVFDSYTIVSYGDVDIAYIGITTPSTITSAFPSQFKDENGEFLYTFNEDKLYDIIQTNIDSAEDAGADYVIALSHIGYGEAGVFTDVTDIIANTDGLDVVLDAHSHSVIEGMTFEDKSGDEVILTSTGTRFEHIGKLTVSEDGLKTELIKTAEYGKTDAEIDAYIAEINESYATLGNRKIGESSVLLNTHDGDTRIIRNNETSLGNFCSDALRTVTESDIAFINGGGIRAPIEAGEVTFNDIFSVFPFNNKIVIAEVTGQTILDVLEMAMMTYPEEDGSFPHMSGLTFRINTSIPSSVKLDDQGFFVEVEGDYRVYGVCVFDKESGEYKPLELDATYVFSGINFHMLDYGSGLSMFKSAKILNEEFSLDVEVLERYITEHLDGKIGEEYASPQGRITFTEGYTDALPYQK